MLYRPLVCYPTIPEYREHFGRAYCAPPSPVLTFDSITVAFWPADFDHAFYGGIGKALFLVQRAQRIDWIGEALLESRADLYQGWDKYGHRYTRRRRVCLVGGNYVVVLELFGQGKGRFVTAFLADPWVIPKIRGSAAWA